MFKQVSFFKNRKKKKEETLWQNLFSKYLELQECVMGEV